MTSENPSQTEPETQRCEGPADEHSDHAPHQMPPTSGPAEPNSPPSPSGQAESRQKDHNWLDYVKLVMEGVALIVLIFYTTFAGLQSCANEKAANAARTAAETAYAQLFLTKRQVDNANDAAKKSFDATVQQFHVDQRAWIGVDNIVGVPTKGQPFIVTVYLKNTGKTPATSVISWQHCGALAELPNVQLGCKKNFHDVGPTQRSNSLTNPGAVLLLDLNPSHGEPLTQNLSEMLGPKQLFYVYGCVGYKDIFASPHWLTFCAYWHERSKNYAQCAKYNNTGDGFLPW